MNKIKLYNVIFPIWLLLFFPPVIFITLIGNFIIDSVVLLICFYIFKLSEKYNMKRFYKKSILKVWMFGFLADILGALILFTIGVLDNHLGVPYEITSAINYNPFSNVLAIIIIIISMLISGLLIFIFNYRFTFKRLILDKKVRFKVALTIATITIPWTFILPTNWFYNGI